MGVAAMPAAACLHRQSAVGRSRQQVPTAGEASGITPAAAARPAIAHCREEIRTLTSERVTEASPSLLPSPSVMQSAD